MPARWDCSSILFKFYFSFWRKIFYRVILILKFLINSMYNWIFKQIYIIISGNCSKKQYIVNYNYGVAHLNIKICAQCHLFIYFRTMASMSLKYWTLFKYDRIQMLIMSYFFQIIPETSDFINIEHLYIHRKWHFKKMTMGYCIKLSQVPPQYIFQPDNLIHIHCLLFLYICKCFIN